MRKGYLLTALAAAVLLAASSGTAYAQSIGFVGTSGRRSEKAPYSRYDYPSSGLTLEIDGSGFRWPWARW